MPQNELDASDARKLWRGYKETAAAVVEMLEAGWSIRRHGNGHPRAYCPCGHGGRSVTMSKTPQNDDNHAARLLANLARSCPEQHDLMK